MGVYERLRCRGLWPRPASSRFGARPRVDFDAARAFENEMSMRRDTIGGRGKLSVERIPSPSPSPSGSGTC